MEEEKQGNEDKQEGDVPRKNNFVYIAFLLGGVGYYLPNYSISAAVDYYQARFPETTIIFDMIATRTVLNAVGFFTNNALFETLNLTWRITLAYITFVAFLIVLTVCDVTLRLFSYHVAYALTLVVMAVLSIGTAVQQSSYYGYANMLPSRYIQAVTVGEGLSGMISSSWRIITKLMLEDLSANTTLHFLGIIIIIIIICCIFFFAARKTQFVKYYLSQSKHDCKEPTPKEPKDTAKWVTEQGTQESVSPTYGATEGRKALYQNSAEYDKENEYQGITNDEDPKHDVAEKTNSTSLPNNHDTKSNEGDNLLERGDGDESSVPLVGSRGFARLKAMLKYRWAVTKQIWKYMTVLALLYFVTVTLFPSIVTEIASASFERVQKTTMRWLLPLSLSRFLYIPLVLLCCLPRHQPIIGGEAWSVIIVFLLAFTNGVCMVASLSAAPSRVAVQDREMCGNLIMMVCVVTMAMGVICSYLIDYLARLHVDHNYCDVTWFNMTSSINVTMEISNISNVYVV